MFKFLKCFFFFRLPHVGSQMEFRSENGCFIGGLLQELENSTARLHFRMANLGSDEIIQIKMKDGLAACFAPVLDCSASCGHAAQSSSEVPRSPSRLRLFKKKLIAPIKPFGHEC